MVRIKIEAKDKNTLFQNLNEKYKRSLKSKKDRWKVNYNFWKKLKTIQKLEEVN